MGSYNSGIMAQTYLLASKVKSKLTQEAVKNDINLRKLVCQANLLDDLIEKLNYHESKMSSSISKDYSYDSIASINALPSHDLPSNVKVAVIEQEYEYKDCDYDEDDYYNDDETQQNTYSEIYYTSDDSDFDSDEDDIDDPLSDEDGSNYIYDCKITSNFYSLGLEKLNLKAADQKIGNANDKENENENENKNENENENGFYGLHRVQSKSHTKSSLNDICDNEKSLSEEHADFPSLSDCSSASSIEDQYIPYHDVVCLETLKSPLQSPSSAENIVIM